MHQVHGTEPVKLDNATLALLAATKREALEANLRAFVAESLINDDLVRYLASELYEARRTLATQHSVTDPVTGRRGAAMQTYSGVEFWPLDPRPEEILIEDIAHGLARECRYGGHTIRYYSVAEHAVLVSLLVEPAYERQALLHDCAEAYVRDLIRPIKYLPELLAFRKFENVLEAAIFDRFGVVCTPESNAAVKKVDDRIVVDEIRNLMRRPEMERAEGFGISITGLEYEAARELFVSRFADLFPEHLQ